MSAAEPTSVCALGAELGEGPVWVGRDAALWSVDIKKRLVHRFDPATSALTSWGAPAQIGWILPAADGTMLAGLQGGVHRFNPASGAFTLIAAVEADRPGNRLNDACTDPAGRIWFGTMDDGHKAPTGHYYRFESGRVIATGLPAAAITNGPAVSPDGRLLYHVDTLGGLVQACEAAADGTLGPSRPFVRIDPKDGHPDGPTVDAEGCVWIGLYGGWAARRYSPAGELLETIRFPVANITKLAFGGEDLRTVYATSARQGLSTADLERQPGAGDLYSFRAAVPGVAVTPAG